MAEKLFVLVVSNKLDAHVPSVLRAIDRYGVEYLRLNTEDFGTAFRGEFKAGEDGELWSLSTSDKVVNLVGVTSVWYRRPESPDISTQLANEARQFAGVELKSFLDNMLVSFDCRWLSEPEAIRRAGHKLHQLGVARAVGFCVPPSLVSQDPEQIRAFRSKMAVPWLSSGSGKSPCCKRSFSHSVSSFSAASLLLRSGGMVAW